MTCNGPSSYTLYPQPMPKLRLFANLREIAGQSTVEIASDTVGGLLDAATAKYGTDFEKGVRVSRIWVNGESASRDDAVGAGDEVVVLPPVSGGSQPVTAVAPVDFLAFAPVLIALAAVVANLANQEIWAAILVGVSLVWALDLNSVFSGRGRLFAPLAVGVAAAGSVMAAHVMGGSGFGLSIGLAVLASVGWAIAVPVYRDVMVYAPTLLVSAIAAMGAASLGLARSSHSPSEAAVDIFLLTVIAGVTLGAVVERAPAMPFLDPFAVTAIGAVLASVAGAVIWDLDVVSHLLVGLGIAVALVAGRGFGSMLRLGRVSLTERLPGVLSSLDGVFLAAAIYYPLLSIIL